MGFCAGAGAASTRVGGADVERTATKATRMAARAGRCWDIGMRSCSTFPVSFWHPN